MQGFESRKAALTLLTGVLQKGEPLDRLMDEGSALEGLEPRDRAFARALTSQTLRHLGAIDWTIDKCMDRTLREKAARARNILRLAVAQLYYFKVPDHAAVDIAVRQADVHRSSKPFKNLVNAVLRRVVREREALEKEALTRGNTPPWLFRRWKEAWGKRAADKITMAHLAEAPLDISVKDQSAVDAWAEKLGGMVLPTGSIRLNDPAPVPDLPGFEDGAWWVQDAAAALPAKLFEIKPGDRALDLCAAPGGKTAMLAARGAAVTAVDKSRSRLERLNENLTRLGLNAEMLAEDAGIWKTSNKPFDHVLLDAPCSATGTVRRHPDVPHLKEVKKIEALTKIQAKLLDAAAQMTAPGGTLVYCTCSLEPEEGENQTRAFLSRHEEFTLHPITAVEIGGEDGFLSSLGEIRTLPFLWGDLGGIDGFYAARFKKAK
jgi:16S rRNA (cytosine967-C5)-methyltransferase